MILAKELLIVRSIDRSHSSSFFCRSRECHQKVLQPHVQPTNQPTKEYDTSVRVLRLSKSPIPWWWLTLGSVAIKYTLNTSLTHSQTQTLRTLNLHTASIDVSQQGIQQSLVVDKEGESCKGTGWQWQLTVEVTRRLSIKRTRVPVTLRGKAYREESQGSVYCCFSMRETANIGWVTGVSCERESSKKSLSEWNFLFLLTHHGRKSE